MGSGAPEASPHASGRPTDTHGFTVSQAAHSPTPSGFKNHGAFVSSIEHGRCLPSLAALAHFADRLKISPSELIDPVKYELAGLYTRQHGSDRDALSGP